MWNLTVERLQTAQLHLFNWSASVVALMAMAMCLSFFKKYYQQESKINQFFYSPCCFASVIAALFSKLAAVFHPSQSCEFALAVCNLSINLWCIWSKPIYICKNTNVFIVDRSCAEKLEWTRIEQRQSCASVWNKLRNVELGARRESATRRNTV